MGMGVLPVVAFNVIRSIYEQLPVSDLVMLDVVTLIDNGDPVPGGWSVFSYKHLEFGLSFRIN